MKKILIISILALMGCVHHKDNIIIRFYSVYSIKDAGVEDMPTHLEFDTIMSSINTNQIEAIKRKLTTKLVGDIFEIKVIIHSHE